MSLRLEDIELIRRVKHRYFRSIDIRDVEALTEIFHPDAEIRYIGGTYDFQAQGRDNIVGALAAAFHNRFASIHAGFCEEINVHTDTAAEGIWCISPTGRSILTPQAGNQRARPFYTATNT